MLINKYLACAHMSHFTLRICYIMKDFPLKEIGQLHNCPKLPCAIHNGLIKITSLLFFGCLYTRKYIFNPFINE